MKKSLCHAVIVAGGSGSRMCSDTPKQFIPLYGKPILMHSIDAFARYDASISIVVALAGQNIGLWQELCRQYQYRTPHQIAKGGATRFHSVKNALNLFSDGGGLVAVHDGVRPLASQQLIARCFQEAMEYGNSVPVIGVVDSVREVMENKSTIIDRSKLRLVQTPQVFDLEELKNAYQQDYSPEFTDDASVMEYSGHQIHLTEGDERNIKITTPKDLALAQWLFNNP